MTKKEEQVLIRAVDELLADDGDFAKAIDALLQLVGGSYPVAHIKPRLITLAEFQMKEQTP